MRGLQLKRWASAAANSATSPRTNLLKPHNSVISNCQVTIFETMSRLAATHEAINLGQGFPDVDGPEDVRRVAADALMQLPNQYPPMLGVPPLREAVAAHFEQWYDLEVDPDTEVLVTAGATEMLAATFFGLLDSGDEVVVIEPTYDCYLPLIRRAGAIPRTVSITAPGWELDLDALAAAFGPRTKAILVNTPQNPCGKVYTDRELAAIADLVRGFDCYAVCDEVYEHMVYGGGEHRTLLSLPGMRERAIKIGSAGKTFSLTGWKIGYAAGSAEMMQSIARAHQYLTFTVPPNLQRAVAYGLGKPRSYFAGLAAEMHAKHDRLAAGLIDVGFHIVPAAGAYFVVADIAPLGWSDDVDFCQHITTEAGVAAVPMSAFYEDRDAPNVPKNFVRFCCCKRDDVLDAAVQRLGLHFGPKLK